MTSLGEKLRYIKNGAEICLKLSIGIIQKRYFYLSFQQVSQPFRLDDKKSLNFDALANIVLHVDVRTILKSFSWAAFALCVAPLLFFRGWHELVLGMITAKE